jgi:pimeloyl-[acyl-carrier protein] methyl ester esterase
MGWLKVEAEKQIYFEHYPGQGPTVILCHGWGMAGQAWANTVARLMDTGRGVVVYDHRGCGQSDKDFTDVSIEALGSDLAALVQHLGLDRVVLNGWSLGGAVVVDAATKLGERLAGLVLTVGATPRYTQCSDFPHGGTAEDVAATVTALRADRQNFLRTLYYEGAFSKDVGETTKQWFWQIAMQASPAADASLAALASVDQRAALAGIDAPTLVFVGEADGVVAPDIGRAAAATASRARLVELAGCGHVPFLEDSDGYHGELHRFMDEVSHG